MLAAAGCYAVAAVGIGKKLVLEKQIRSLLMVCVSTILYIYDDLATRLPTIYSREVLWIYNIQKEHTLYSLPFSLRSGWRIDYGPDTIPLYIHTLLVLVCW